MTAVRPEGRDADGLEPRPGHQQPGYGPSWAGSGPGPEAGQGPEPSTPSPLPEPPGRHRYPPPGSPAQQPQAPAATGYGIADAAGYEVPDVAAGYGAAAARPQEYPPYQGYGGYAGADAYPAPQQSGYASAPEYGGAPVGGSWPGAAEPGGLRPEDPGGQGPAYEDSVFEGPAYENPGFEGSAFTGSGFGDAGPDGPRFGAAGAPGSSGFGSPGSGGFGPSGPGDGAFPGYSSEPAARTTAPFEPVGKAAAETAALPTAAPAPDGATVPGTGAGTGLPGGTGPAGEGRAARRRAAREQPPNRQASSHRRAGAGGGRRRRGRGPNGVPVKEGPGLIAVRVMGELFITFGVVMFLFVAYQLWWTNVRADEYTAGTDHNLEKKWGTSSASSGQDSGSSFPQGQVFAIIYIPKLDVEAPVAEGTDKTSILDKGEVGHYNGALETAFPWDRTGNFALAGHRNTHGEPFRYINKLGPGDQVIVETAHDYYTYKITSTLPQTDPSNVSVIKPVPAQSGFTKPGRYITLTTCTPEFTSTYRLIVWGVMTDVRPRSEGKPAALTGG